MAIQIIGGTSGVVQDVNAGKAAFVTLYDAAGNPIVDSDKHIPVNVRPPPFGSLGIYRGAFTTGAITATLGASSPLFSFRWTDATRLALIQRVLASAYVVATITTSVPFDLAAYFARSFTASDSAGTAITVSTGQKLRTSMGASLVGDMRIASTGLLTAGTRSLDTYPLGRIAGTSGTVVGTQFFGANSPLALIDAVQAQTHPVVLAQNEGIIVQSPLAGPATGTFTVLVVIEWAEVAAY